MAYSRDLIVSCAWPREASGLYCNSQHGHHNMRAARPGDSKQSQPQAWTVAQTGFTQRCQFTVLCLSYSKIQENFFFLKTSPIWEIIFSLTKAASKLADESALSRWDMQVNKAMQRVGEFLGERHLLIIFICCSKMESFHRVPADCICSHIQDNLRNDRPPPQINI